ncbi:apoptosis-resistant E3 ubiquitin protein ligase 1-like [Eleginops maclovinus]|uniref:apoptosis-resistant E3 ubiquitin protein ligase 1-like n=1 Tax=Eleginops maclovinus TaxID=56733 RepID=UPI00308086BF
MNYEEEEAVEEAMMRSLYEDTDVFPRDFGSANILTREEISGILKAHADEVVTATLKPIHISRSNVWTTAVRQFSRTSFAENLGTLYVTFASDEMDGDEDAADLGGPRREFFRLLVRAIFKDSGAFEETPNGFIPRMNIRHVQQKLYKMIGQMMATIIVQGGEPPAFLAPHVVDYIMTGDINQVHVTPDDLADASLRDSLKRIKGAGTQDELEKILECCEWRFDVEGLPNPVTMENKHTFVNTAALYNMILQRQSCLNQLIDGLSYYKVLPLLKDNPSMRIIILDMPTGLHLTPEVLAGLLKPSYSVLGSNRRPKEELIVVKFRAFLQSVQSKELDETFQERALTETEQDFLHNISLGHILAFVTGSSQVPATGFEPYPKMSFVHDDKHLPIAHTCSNELQLFINSKTLADGDFFEYSLLVALMNGGMFSAV